MEVYTIKISRKGQIVIPKKFRDRLSTDILEVAMEGNKIVLVPVDSIQALGGKLRKYIRNAKGITRRQQEDEYAWEAHVREKRSVQEKNSVCR